MEIGVKNKIFTKTSTSDAHLYSNQDLRKLLVPIIVEQLLSSLMGTADTMMVSNVGSAAISAVSLVFHQYFSLRHSPHSLQEVRSCVPSILGAATKKLPMNQPDRCFCHDRFIRDIVCHLPFIPWSAASRHFRCRGDRCHDKFSNLFSIYPVILSFYRTV